MRVFKIKAFHRWAEDEGVLDTALLQAVEEIQNDRKKGNLGGHVYKKRVALPGRGKSSSVRTFIAFKFEDRAFLMYGFAKKKQTNIKENELRALKKMASELLAYNDEQLAKAIDGDKLFEVKTDG